MSRKSRTKPSHKLNPGAALVDKFKQAHIAYDEAALALGFDAVAAQEAGTWTPQLDAAMQHALPNELARAQKAEAELCAFLGVESGFLYSRTDAQLTAILDAVEAGGGKEILAFMATSSPRVPIRRASTPDSVTIAETTGNRQADLARARASGATRIHFLA